MMKNKNKKFSQELNNILNNDDGIAIMLVMTAIVLLTTIMITFSFDSNINKIKAFNIEDKGQAKLTAEAGLNFGMARLKLYKEAFNYLQENESAKDFATPDVINSIWNFPFVYPIPITKGMNQIQKDSIEKFQDEENNFLRGSLKLTINNISNKINLNLIRVSHIIQAAEAAKEENQESEEEKEKNAEYNAENQIIKSLKYSIEKKSENDEYFQSKYYGVDPIMLVNILKVNSSDPETLQDDGGALGEFDQIKVKPKKAPFTSFSEIYSMPMWDDDLVDLIKSEFTVHGAIMIDLNKITDKMLRLLIPTINDEEVKEFFEYKDDPEDPKTFNNKEDFKKYVVQIGSIISSDEFDERMALFEKQGIKFGPSPTLFQIIAVGQKGRATYTITAYVSLPAKPLPVEKKKPNENAPNNPVDPNDPNKPADPNDPNDPNKTTDDEDKKDEKKKQKTQLLNPRIIEIFIS